MSARWIFIDVEINNMHKIDSLYQFPIIITDDKANKLNTLFDQLFATDNMIENYGDCYKLLNYLLQTAVPIKKEPHHEIQNAVDYIKDNYCKQITIEHLANICRMSESNFYAVFKKTLGNSPIAYLNHYRLSLAATKLSESNQPISEISYAVGINDPLYFSRLFKKTYGISPKEYRHMYRGTY